ncbi:MAG: hypothetical protein JWN48_2257, partial [Myxococcaceae bacterium]|nr:hypothetical protein [Myxococcaceae bacterium]
MIEGDDLSPLDAPQSQSPEALVRALRALGRQQPSPAALREIALRLDARLSESGLPESQTRGTHALGHKLLGARMWIAALAIGAGATALSLRQVDSAASSTASVATTKAPAPVSPARARVPDGPLRAPLSERPPTAASPSTSSPASARDEPMPARQERLEQASALRDTEAQQRPHIAPRRTASVAQVAGKRLGDAAAPAVSVPTTGAR